MTRSFRSTRPRRSVDDLSVLFGSAWADVVGFAHRRVGCAALAEDIAAIVFAEAVRAHERGVQIERGWLFTVARRRIVDHRRRSGRQADLETLLRSVWRLEAATWPDDRLDDLLEGLQELPESYRTVLAAKYLDGRSVTEIADRLGVSYKAAESTLARARRALLANLEPELEEAPTLAPVAHLPRVVVGRAERPEPVAV